MPWQITLVYWLIKTKGSVPGAYKPRVEREYIDFVDFATFEIILIIYYFEDLQKLPFYDATKTNQKLDFLLQPSMDYQKVISESQAKKIFYFFQDYFNKFGFDPFTFTTEELTKQEKVNFIHS